MGAGGIPFPTSNNAPLPIPGGYGNPTGINTGGYGMTPNTGFNFPAYGSPTMGVGGGGTPFPAYNTGSFTGTNLGGLNSGLGFQWGQGYGSDLYNRLGRSYGRGAGQLLGNIMSGGLFNPQVAAAYLNAQQPGIARGEAGILGAFGDAGARFSSASALGLGDYESQVQLNQQQMLAQMFQNAQGEELSLLKGVLPTLQQERANEGGTLNKVIGGIETVGGIAAAPFTGGASLMMTAQGLKTLSGGGGGGMGGGGGFSLPGFGGNTGTFGNNAPVSPFDVSNQSTWDWMAQGQDQQMAQSAMSLGDMSGGGGGGWDLSGLTGALGGGAGALGGGDTTGLIF